MGPAIERARAERFGKRVRREGVGGGCMSSLILPRAVYNDLRAHGEQAYPEECCGALLGVRAGEGWSISAAVRAANASRESARRRYHIAPGELVAIVRDARRRNLEVAGFYHSHPDHPAQWSQTDLEEAHWIGCSYVITQVEGGEATATSAFLLAGTMEEDKHFEPQTIEVVD